MACKFFCSTLFAILMLGLSGCDAWPTTIENKTDKTISISYHHKDYKFWSAAFEIKNRRAIDLARAHFFEDITSFKISDGSKTYIPSKSAMVRFHDICDQAYNCYISYYGSGKIRVSHELPDGMVYDVDINASQP